MDGLTAFQMSTTEEFRSTFVSLFVCRKDVGEPATFVV
jgi:hypothetical protein